MLEPRPPHPPPPAENLHHALTSQPTCIANKMAACNIKRTQNQKRNQNRSEYQLYYHFII